MRLRCTLDDRREPQLWLRPSSVYHLPRRSGRSPALPYPPSRRRKFYPFAGRIPDTISFRFLRDATIPISFRFLRDATRGQWRYLYRAVDKQGQTVDFLLSKNRDRAAAVRFFKKAIGNNEVPEKITLDGSRASHQTVAELKTEGVLPAQAVVQTNKYLNNMIEQDHRRVKQRCYPMLGFKTFGNAEVTLSGIELANKIKKGQFDTSEITSPGAM